MNSQPAIRIDTDDVELYPDIKMDEGSDVLSRLRVDNERYCFSMNLRLSNIGNNMAQNLCVDGGVFFRTIRPLRKRFLPIHLPEYVDTLMPYRPGDKSSVISAHISFDNYIAKQVIVDFFETKKKKYGMPFLPFERELMQRGGEWPSPRLVVKCFYSDIQGNEYVSQKSLFFHVWLDPDEKKLKMYLLNMGELDFTRTRRISRRARWRHFQNSRHLRYTAFDGKPYKRNDRILLFRSGKSEPDSRQKE